ncbi:MAG TPA: alpha/beta hydrolase-fold protein [Thermoanaerobaculaceae bacterium]|nr:alpha/beta hydrolase-fold protein [Thermoanaerobaculaceae bacterium]
MIAEIEAGRRTTPLVVQPAKGADATVTFLIGSSDGRVPRIVSDVTGWGENAADDTFDVAAGTMTRVGSSDWYRLDARVAPGARIEYLIVQGRTDYRTDPHNPRRAAFHGDEGVSEFVAPDYAPPAEASGSPGAPAGVLTDDVIESRALGGARRAAVYTPPGYRRDSAYPVAVFHALWGASGNREIARLLDRLTERRAIPPVVAAFLESHRAGDPDFHAGAPMRAFLDREVPAWLAARFGVTKSGGERAILAVSFGAKDALDAALDPAGAYGRLGLLIPGRRLTRADLDAVAAHRPARLRAAILAGLYDRSNLATARAARQALADAGDAVEYIEVPEGHNPATWRNHLGEVLVSVFRP